MKKLLLVLLILLVGCNPVEPTEPVDESETVVVPIEEDEPTEVEELETDEPENKDEPIEINQPVETDPRYINEEFQKEAEANAKEYVAQSGQVLVTKGDYDFTGMKYYFKGELIANELDEVGNSLWLLKNEHGYIMPVEHMHFEAEIGDEVEVWGNLSGEGYKILNFDNVVGQTGFIYASFATVNGEIQY